MINDSVGEIVTTEDDEPASGARSENRLDSGMLTSLGLRNLTTEV